MAIEYPIVNEYNMVDGTIQVSPYWFLCVIRFQDLVTFDRTGGNVNRSFPGVMSNPTATRDPIIITDVMQLNINSNKESHVHTLSAAIMQADVNYLSSVMPGDWIFAWILNDQGKAQDVLQRVKNTATGNGNAVANKWDDGLKFVGRVQGVRKTTQVSRETGTITSAYLINAVAFQEFDSKIFYDAQLTRDELAPIWLQRFGLIVQNIMSQNAFCKTDGTVDINAVIPAILSVTFGKGAFKNAGGIGDVYVPPNQAYLVPPEVSAIIGKTTFAYSTTTNYASILDVLMGVQHYNKNQNATQASPWALFVPDGLSPIPDIDNDLTWFNTPNKMLGYFGLEFPPMNGIPVWNLLQNFLNAPLNEMYVTLRVNDVNQVVPTLVVRQLPFSTARNPKDVGHQSGNAYPADNGIATTTLVKSQAKKGQTLLIGRRVNIRNANSSPTQIPDYDVTRFLEIPRWVVDESMIYSIDIGRSNVQRFNFIHIGGTSNAANSPQDSTGTYVRAPPLRDDADIQRSGLRIFQTTVNTVLLDAFGGPVQWRDILADIVSGEQLTLTGTFVVQGISAPICVGDNLEFANTLYHIESVTHSCTIDVNSGRKQFQTSIAVSHGLANEYQQQDTLDAGGTSDESLFAGIVETEPVTFDVPETSEQDPSFDNIVPGSE